MPNVEGMWNADNWTSRHWGTLANPSQIYWCCLFVVLSRTHSWVFPIHKQFTMYRYWQQSRN